MAGFDETFDFVVVGSGGGSMCAALVMRAQGRSVAILEKTGFVGGTTARSGGVMWIPNNPFMARDGVEDSFDLATRYLDHVVGDRDDTPGTSPARRAAYVAEAPRMIEFLTAQGIALDRVDYWPDYYDEAPGGSEQGRTVVAAPFDKRELGAWADKLQPGFLEMPATLSEALEIRLLKRRRSAKLMMAKIALRMVGAKLRGRHWVSAGAALQGRMLQAALRAGVDIRTGMPAGTLIVEDGRVTGVVATREGKPWRIGARSGVLVNAGGFSRNQAMRDRYQPGTRAEWSQTTEGDTGEMIEEMMRIGAAVGQMDQMVGYQATLPPGSEAALVKPHVQNMTASPHAILVDQSGTRYQNEGGSYMDYCAAMLARHRTVPAVPSWAVFDDRHARSYMIAGRMAGQRLPKAWLRSGYLKRADTIAGLAAAIGCEPAALEATVARFNGFCAAGRDGDFGRGDRAYDRWLGDPTHVPSPTLGAIEQAPFYALPVVPGDVGTYGGVVTDSLARVLRADGAPIRGLYATGISTASVFGQHYAGAGASVGPSFVWGWIAAKHAAGADNIVGAATLAA